MQDCLLTVGTCHSYLTVLCLSPLLEECHFFDHYHPQLTAMACCSLEKQIQTIKRQSKEGYRELPPAVPFSSLHLTALAGPAPRFPW